MKKILLILTAFLSTLNITGQDTLSVIRINEQRNFPEEVPAGNYSGITYLGDSLYAVVSDKSPKDGFFIFKITLDSITGEVQDVRNLGFKGDTDTKGDLEAIAYIQPFQTLYITRELNNTVKEYSLDGHITIKELIVPSVYQRGRHNYGLESLSYNDQTKTFWTCNEGTLQGDGELATEENGLQNQLRLQSFSLDFQPLHQYAYQMDKPEANKKAYLYGNGVSEVLALDDHSVLVLEREFFTPISKLGAFVSNKLYRVFPNKSIPIEQIDSLMVTSPYLKKQLVTKWRTALSLFNHEIANYEGMCLGPKLTDGSQVIVFVSDSQDQAGGVMKDWFKTIVFRLSDEKVDND